MQQQGDFKQEDYFNLVGGLNLTDSPFVISDNQATGGYNYDYVKTGGITKSLSPITLNSVADAQLYTRNISLHNTKYSVKNVLRASTTGIKSFSLAGIFSSLLSEDTSGAGTSIFDSSSTVPTVSSMFTKSNTDILWYTGGGLSRPYGAYSDSKFTKNGADAPSGSLGTPSLSSPGGSWTTTGNYYYAVSLVKASTGAESNAALDVLVTITNTNQIATISFSGITGLDTTKYGTINLYRSAVGGASKFTTGNLIAKLPSTTTSYDDIGSVIVASSTNIPRAGNAVLDNSVLGDLSYKAMTIFKRRLVVASASTVYLSDLNKDESWPIENFIEVPTGGEIKGLAVISFNTPTSTSLDEILAIFKEDELWVITGDDVDTWSLKFIDKVGCPSQPLIVTANGYLLWVDARGVYLWDGAGKPVYISRPIEFTWGPFGDLDKLNLYLGFGTFYKKVNQVIWVLSSSLQGIQKLAIRLDLRLTLPSVSNTLGERILDGVFHRGKLTNPMYAGLAYNHNFAVSLQDEVFITGDNSGYVYRQYYSYGSTGNDVAFSYETRYLDMKTPGRAKRFHKVIVWVDMMGNWDLLLDYWADYRSRENEYTTIPVTISPANGATDALWDVAQWDVAKWDDYSIRPRALIFNLSSFKGNNEGDALKLRFRNENTLEPVTINGFSVLYSDLGMRK